MPEDKITLPNVCKVQPLIVMNNVNKIYLQAGGIMPIRMVFEWFKHRYAVSKSRKIIITLGIACKLLNLLELLNVPINVRASVLQIFQTSYHIANSARNRHWKIVL